MTFYAVQTESGSWYLIEQEKPHFHNQVWKIYRNNQEFFIIGLMLVEEVSISADQIVSIKQFMGKQIYFAAQPTKELTITLTHTTIIKQVVEFK